MPRGDLMQDEISLCGYSSCVMHMYLLLLKKCYYIHLHSLGILGILFIV